MAKLATFLHCEEKIVYLPLTVATLVYIQPRVKKTTLIQILTASPEACTRFEFQQRTGQQVINLFKPADKSTNLHNSTDQDVLAHYEPLIRICIACFSVFDPETLSSGRRPNQYCSGTVHCRNKGMKGLTYSAYPLCLMRRFGLMFEGRVGCSNKKEWNLFFPNFYFIVPLNCTITNKPLYKCKFC